jgi:hypothetical protein
VVVFPSVEEVVILALLEEAISEVDAILLVDDDTLVSALEEVAIPVLEAISEDAAILVIVDEEMLLLVSALEEIEIPVLIEDAIILVELLAILVVDCTLVAPSEEVVLLLILPLEEAISEVDAIIEVAILVLLVDDDDAMSEELVNLVREVRPVSEELASTLILVAIFEELARLEGAVLVVPSMEVVILRLLPEDATSDELAVLKDDSRLVTPSVDVVILVLNVEGAILDELAILVDDIKLDESPSEDVAILVLILVEEPISDDEDAILVDDGRLDSPSDEVAILDLVEEASSEDDAILVED